MNVHGFLQIIVHNIFILKITFSFPSVHNLVVFARCSTSCSIVVQCNYHSYILVIFTKPLKENI